MCQPYIESATAHSDKWGLQCTVPYVCIYSAHRLDALVGLGLSTLRTVKMHEM